MDTINRLLKKQAPKRRGKAVAEIAAEGGAEEPEAEEPKAHSVYVRYIQNRQGTVLGVPGEWLDGPAGRVFQGDMMKGGMRPFSGRMVEEV